MHLLRKDFAVTISSISPLGIVSNMFQVSGLAGINQLVQPQGTGLANATNARDSSAISSAGQFFSKLQQLRDKDPKKFQELMSQIASQLNTAARQQGHGFQGQFLAHLASNFQRAARTGDLTPLQPSPQAYGNLGHLAYLQNQPNDQQAALSVFVNPGNQAAFNPSVQQVLSSILAQVNKLKT